MKVSLLIRILLIFLCIFSSVFPVSLNAAPIDSRTKEIELVETMKAPKQMTEKEMNDLFGEDPYLGQTSYLQSPDGYSQRENSK
tara:strand:- start:139 stop:390 length:252 start_codon:yes stop_codon:yes gene_type:complete